MTADWKKLETDLVQEFATCSCCLMCTIVREHSISLQLSAAEFCAAAQRAAAEKALGPVVIDESGKPEGFN